MTRAGNHRAAENHRAAIAAKSCMHVASLQCTCMTNVLAADLHQRASLRRDVLSKVTDVQAAVCMVAKRMLLTYLMYAFV